MTREELEAIKRRAEAIRRVASDYTEAVVSRKAHNEIAQDLEFLVAKVEKLADKLEKIKSYCQLHSERKSKELSSHLEKLDDYAKYQFDAGMEIAYIDILGFINEIQ